MKYFVCALGGAQIGIPTDRIERIIPAPRTQITIYETDNETGFISLPALLQLTNISAPHGLVIKSKKIVLLTPKIDVELEIPEENIHSLPEALSGQLLYFSGASFNNEQVILLLDVKKLTENYND